MVSATLLEVAVDQFGRRGFEGASTREIARASNTAMSSITYHFGGKEGLYLAAAEHIASRIAEFQKPAFEAARAAGSASREAAVEAILGVLDRFAQLMLAPQSEVWSRFIIREQQAPTAAFDRLYSIMMAPHIDVLMELMRRARPDLGDREARATGMLLFGQGIMLRASLATVCRILEVEQIGPEDAALLRKTLRANVLCILAEKS